MSTNTPKIDGAAAHRAAVERAGEIGSDAVAHAHAVAEALHLPEAPVSPHAPPPYPAPPYPAPPYPPRAQEPAPSPPAPEAPAPQGDPPQSGT